MAIFSGFLAITGLSSLAGSLTIFGLSPGLSSAIIGVGKSLLWNAAAAALGPKPKVSAQEVQAVLSQPTSPRVRGYGQTLLGGTRAFFESNGAGTLTQIVCAHHGPATEVVRWWVDGQVVSVGVDGAANSTQVAGWIYLGAILSGDGGDSAFVRTNWPGIWTTEHKLTDIATYHVSMIAPPLDQLSNIFPRNANTVVQMEAKLSPVMDPRTMLVGYSALTGPCALDYLTHADGYRIPLAAIDLDSFAQFTDLCDQNVALSAGGAENRYSIGGYYTLEDAPKDVMARILATADAQLFMTAEGKVGILGGEWLEPDVTITSPDILAFSLSDGSDVFTDFNVLKGIYTSAAHRYQETECDEMRDEVALASEPERVDTFAVDMCPSYTQMRRLMKARWAAQHREWSGTITTNLVGLKARFPRGRGKHVIRLMIDDLEIDQVFEVMSHSYSVRDRTCQITVASIENPYTWDPDTEEGAEPTPLVDLENPSTETPPPANLTLTQQLFALSADRTATQIVAQVDDPGRSDLQLEARYRVSPGGDWQPMTVGLGALRAYSGVLSDGVTYDVAVRWVGEPWSDADIESLTAVSNPTAPDAASALASTEAGGTVTLSWVNGSAGYYQTRIYRGASAVFSGASVIATVTGVAGAAQDHDDAPGSGTWHYWAVTINPSLVEASPTGPVSETI